jgi:hypothetical protein
MDDDKSGSKRGPFRARRFVTRLKLPLQPQSTRCSKEFPYRYPRSKVKTALTWPNRFCARATRLSVPRATRRPHRFPVFHGLESSIVFNSNQWQRTTFEASFTCCARSNRTRFTICPGRVPSDCRSASPSRPWTASSRVLGIYSKASGFWARPSAFTMPAPASAMAIPIPAAPWRMPHSRPAAPMRSQNPPRIGWLPTPRSVRIARHHGRSLQPRIADQAAAFCYAQGHRDRRES